MDLTALSAGLTFAGAGLAVGMGCAGSAKGIGTAAQAAAGVLSEKPHLFGRMLVLLALPGTQGFYGFIMMMMIVTNTGLPTTINTGISLFFMGFGVGLALLMSAIWQGQASAASIGLVSRRESDFGRSLILPAMVETYAVVGLLAGILALNFIQ